MVLLSTRNYSLKWQFIWCLGFVFASSIGCYFGLSWLDHTLIALILLMSVSLLAMLFDIFPVLSAAVLSAVIWNYFFIPPRFTFHIDRAQDVMLFLLYFVIALVNAVLSFKIREAERKARDKEEKEKSIILYNTLLNSLSHELRTPISTIIGAVDTLQIASQNLTQSQQAQLLNEIDIASMRLNRQVDNLLNMSRLESGFLQLKLDWCDVNELIHVVIHKQESAHQSRFRFEPNERLPLYKIDAGLMEQVLQNLCHNALQYTPENSKIDIEVWGKDNKLQIKVRDHGKGFPIENIHQVFEKFYRLPHAKPGGSGLGLSIVKGYVEAHNGQITLENAKDGGALFCIEIVAETSFLSNLKND